MKNLCLLLLSGLSLTAVAQNHPSGLQAINAAMLAKSGTIDVYEPGKAQVMKALLPMTGPSLPQEAVRPAPLEKKTIAVTSLTLDRFSYLGTLNARQKNLNEEAKLTVFNESGSNTETGIYVFSTKQPQWKGRPYIYCTNCGTALLQLKVEKDQKYLVQISLASEKKNQYELFTLPDLLSPQVSSFNPGTQEIFFMIAPKQSGYISYYLRCVESVDWTLSGIQISKEK
jgi:hypothetical protein